MIFSYAQKTCPLREKRRYMCLIRHCIFFFFCVWRYHLKENKFQSNLKKELRQMFPGCIVTKLDSADIPGIPDLLILFKDKWAALECKRSIDAHKRPNQDYYVNLFNEMSFSRFICPENKEDVLNELYKTFKS